MNSSLNKLKSVQNKLWKRSERLRVISSWSFSPSRGCWLRGQTLERGRTADPWQNRHRKSGRDRTQRCPWRVGQWYSRETCRRTLLAGFWGRHPRSHHDLGCFLTKPVERKTWNYTIYISTLSQFTKKSFNPYMKCNLKANNNVKTYVPFFQPLGLV